MRTIEYPGADQVSLGRPLSSTLLTPRFQDIHTMAGTLNGTRNYFSEAGRAYSHFGTGGLGEVEQWQDLAFKAASDLDGNPWSVSWENADRGPGFSDWSGSDVPYFTDSQADAIIHGVAWVCVRLVIPPVPVYNSLPIPNGLSVHRWGIDPWRVAGGIRYSSAYGKVCPGDRRKDQFYNTMVPEIQNLVYGSEEALTEAQMTELKTYIQNEIRLAMNFITHGPNSRFNPGLANYEWADDEDVWHLRKLQDHLNKVDAHGGSLEDPNNDGQLTWKMVRHAAESLDLVREIHAAVVAGDPTA